MKKSINPHKNKILLLLLSVCLGCELSAGEKDRGENEQQPPQWTHEELEELENFTLDGSPQSEAPQPIAPKVLLTGAGLCGEYRRPKTVYKRDEEKLKIIKIKKYFLFKSMGSQGVVLPWTSTPLLELRRRLYVYNNVLSDDVLQAALDVTVHHLEDDGAEWHINLANDFLETWGVLAIQVLGQPDEVRTLQMFTKDDLVFHKMREMPQISNLRLAQLRFLFGCFKLPLSEKVFGALFDMMNRMTDGQWRSYQAIAARVKNNLSETRAEEK